MKNKYSVCNLFTADLPAFTAQKTAWRQATDAELASLLAAAPQVEKEHIETEMRTAFRHCECRGHTIAGCTADGGYSRGGQVNSHYLIVQTGNPHWRDYAQARRIIVLNGPRAHAGDELSVHFYMATTGAPVGVAVAHRSQGQARVEEPALWLPPTRH